MPSPPPPEPGWTPPVRQPNLTAALVLGVLLVLLGLALLRRQCSDLRRRMRGAAARRREEELEAHRSDLLSFRAEVRRSQDEVKAEVETEMRAVMNMQRDASRQLSELKGALENLVHLQSSESRATAICKEQTDMKQD